MNLKHLLFASILLIAISSPQLAASTQHNPEIDRDPSLNLTHQIQLHPRILIIVTVPWCGESLSLMRELSSMIAENGTGIEGLKLMKLYRNKEKNLGEVINVTEDISIIYYHDSVPYKYRGRLRALNIIRSIAKMNSLEASEIPLKSLNTEEELMEFVESVDKAVILVESCGWTSRLLNKGTSIDTLSEAKASYSRVIGFGEAQKVAGLEDTLMCDIHKGFHDFHSFQEFSSLNGSTSSTNLDGSDISTNSPCNSKNFQLFEIFFTRFINSAREIFLPLEKQRFGHVSNRSFITSLGFNGSSSWSVMLRFAGCPDCTKLFKEGDNLDNFLQMDVPLVTELEDDDGHHAEVVLGDNPSLILFVDRFSNSSSVREASKGALKALREVALSYQDPFLTGHSSNTLSVAESAAAEAQKKTIVHPKLALSPTNQMIKSTQKMSIVIMDGEKHVSIEKLASDLQGSSLQKILDQIIKPAKGTKLSLVAKNAGFQLLSDDLDIQVEESVQTGTESSHYQHLPVLSLGDSAEKEAEQTFSDAASHISLDKSFEPVTSQCSSSECEKITNPSVEPSSNSETCHLVSLTDIIGRTKECSSLDVSDESSTQLKKFKGNFYFSDGGYRLLKSLTGGFKMPSLVIIDPTLRTHYIVEEGASLNSFCLIDFVHRFTNKSLSPFQRSGSSDAKPREATLPSRLTVDTHDKESVPKVSAHILSNILLNLREPHAHSSDGGCKEDVLVLFSNSWCAFCQRMELVIREVYNSLKGYEKVLEEKSRNAKLASNDNPHNMALKTPRIYAIDCTTNDCRTIMESTGQIEAYPSLLLFPADGKDAVTYDGNVEVSGIIKFLTYRGSDSSHLVGEKGILWATPDSNDNNLKVFESSNSLDPDILNKPNEQFEIRLISNSPKHPAKQNWIQPEISEEVTLPPSSKVTVGSVLVATAKLLEAYPFDLSKILIVKADENVGYQGLILNKHINWNSFQQLTEDSEILTLAPLSLGGPVIANENPLVALARKHIKNDYPEVIPSVYFLDQAATAQEINDIKLGNRLNVSDYWFFLGYSSWGWEQLDNEIADGAWKVNNISSTQFQWP